MPKSGAIIGVSDQEERDRRELKGAEVWDLKLNGWANRDIAEKTGVPLRTVQQWLKDDREQAAQQREDCANTDLALTVSRNENIYKIAMEAIKQTVTNEDGTQQVFMDHKSADIALKALKEMARLMALGVKDEKTGSETLEALILASLGQKEVPQIVEVEVVDDK